MLGAVDMVRQCLPRLLRCRAACLYQAASWSTFANSGREGLGSKALAAVNGRAAPGLSSAAVSATLAVCGPALAGHAPWAPQFDFGIKLADNRGSCAAAGKFAFGRSSYGRLCRR